ncbi:hypothetical protein QUB56_18820 [Microcoleus sp. AR_TQ3_B6]|uniref:hypothetical protein n=1 Tax=Microcoleus sp. AR_TQ3_B6 TaxID=3055284 RepID=UPI002FD39FAD
MKITFVLPTLSLTGGIRVVSIFAERLRKRGHSVLVISLPHPQPSMRQQVKLQQQGRGWISPPENKASFFDNLGVEHKIIDRYRPVESICQLPNSKWQALSEAAYAKANNYTWEDATAYFEAALKVAVDKSKQRDVNIVSFSPYYYPAAAKQQIGVGC